MRNLKKLVALIVTIAMIATLAVSAFAATPADVKGTDYEGAVTRLVALGVITGYPNGDFGPNDSITRAQAAAVVVRALGYESIADSAKGVTKFSDVAASYWGAGYINLAVSLNLIKGYGNGKFGPEDKVTYEQIVTMIVRALGMDYAAELKGGFPTGYLLQGKVIGFTNDVKGVSGTNANRGIVALLVDNAKTAHIYQQTTVGSSQAYEDTKLTFLDKLGIKVQAEGVVISQTPASAGLDANKFVAGGANFTAIAGAVDLESLLGKKVDLWGKDASNIILAENASGTALTVKSVTVTGDVYTATLADDTTKDYTVVKDAQGFSNLKASTAVAALANVNKADASQAKIDLVIDSDGNIQFAQTVYFDKAYQLGVDPSENKVEKNIKIAGTSVYAKLADKAPKKLIIEKDGAIVDWTALKQNDVIFVAVNGDVSSTSDKIDSSTLYIKATSKTVTGTLDATKGSPVSSFKVDGTWYDKSVKAAIVTSDYTLGNKVTVTLDPAGKVYAVKDADASVSTDKYAVVLYQEKSTSMGDASYKVKLLTSTGDTFVYSIADNDNTKDFRATITETSDKLKGTLVSYHIATDGSIDSITDKSDAGKTGTFNPTRGFLDKDITSDTVIFLEKKSDKTYSTKAYTDIKSGSDARAISYFADGDKMAAILLSDDTFTATTTDAVYGYVDSYESVKDGFNVTVITADGAKPYFTSAKPTIGAVVSYTLDASNKLTVKDTISGTDILKGTIVSVDSGKIKISKNGDGKVDYTKYFADKVIYAYDKEEDGGATVLTNADLAVDQKVTVYLNADGDVAAVVVTMMQ